MSEENLNVHARLSATDEASPVVRKLQAELRKLEGIAKRFNAGFSNVSASMSGLTAKMTRDISRVASISRASSRRYAADWSAANASRLSDAQRMYSQLERLESRYRRDLRQSETMMRRSAGAGRSMVAARFPAPRIRSMAFGGAIGGAAIASAFKSRIGVNKAETAAEMFADMTGDEVKKLRKSFADVAGIKYGVGSAAAINAFTEGAKAGIPKEHGQVFADLALKAGAGLDLDFGATSKLLGRIATLRGDYSQSFLYGALNAIGVANNTTAADAGEIVDALRRSLSALVSTKMDIRDLAAFNAAGVSIGLQPNKVGTFTGFLTSELANAGTARGQRGKDLNRAANMLGFGGRSNIARRMIANPTQTLLSIFERMQAMPEAKRSNIATLIGRTEWRDELMALSGARDLIARSIKEIAEKPKFLDEASLKKIRSLEGRWNSIASALKLVWEKIGAGFENIFTQVSDWVIKFATGFNFDSIKDRVNALIEGLKKGFGVTDIGESLTGFANNFSESDVQRWKNFGKGFAEGVSGFVSGIKDAFNLVAGIVGKGDAGAMGKLIAQFAALTVALAALNPVIGVISSITALAMSLAGLSFFLSAGGVGAAAGAAGAGIASRLGMLGPIGAAISGALFGGNRVMKDDSTMNFLRKWRKERGYGDDLPKKQSYLGDSEEAGKLFKRAAFESDGGFAGLVHKTGLKTSIDGLKNQIDRISTDIRPAAFTPGKVGYGSFFGSDVSGSARGNPLLKNIPGTKLPDFGMSSRGIIKGGSDSIVSIPPGGVGDASIGMGLKGSAFLAARRARFAEEIKNDPTLRIHLAAMQATEGISGGGTIESLMNRADMQGKSLRQMLGFSADGKINPRSFYGPIRRGEIYGAIRRLQNNPKEFAKYDKYTNRALAGGHAIGGYTDQGLPTDPNGSRRTGIKGFKISPKDGNEFTDWVGPGSKWGRGRQGAINYRKFLENGINGEAAASKVPSPNEAIQNVPPPSAIPGAGQWTMNGGNGPIAININGSNHDPEALAALVQRRVTETMNWRTHDVDYSMA